MEKKKILLLYTDKYYLIKQVYPFGLDLIADYLRQCGYDVTIEYPYLPDPDPETNLVNILEQSDPDIIGLGIRNLDTCMSCEEYGDFGGDEFKAFYFLPEVKRLVDFIKKHAPGLPTIAGGGAFTISPIAILKYLGIEYGVVGEGEEPMRLFIEAFPDTKKISKIPNLAYLKDDYVVNPRQDYRFGRDSWPFGRDKKFNYAFETTGLPVQVKRGCNQRCSYCVEPFIEGKKSLFRDIDQVIAELKTVSETHEAINTIFFVDTEFNVPDLAYCSRLVRRIMEDNLHQRFSFSSQFLPKPFDLDFAKILAEAGFSIILTCDSFADSVLKKNRVSYRQADITNALRLCEEYGISCTLSMIFGLPGETYETLNHSLEQMNRYPPHFLRRYEYTIGGRIYQDTTLCESIEKDKEERHLYGMKSDGYLEPFYYCSPENPMKLKQYIQQGFPYPMAYQNYYDETVTSGLAVAYLADQGSWGEAVFRFLESDLAVRSSIYEYLFRKLTDAGRIDDARTISENLLEAIYENGETSPYRDQIELIQFYLSCLG
ncbi:MAG: radical SAM protein [Deltaproteobacteria bacterium]|nr:radical SAM protein [Deltaproteobacteria bacterium]